jgi:hypothetical protein
VWPATRTASTPAARRVFETRINRNIRNAEAAYESMRYRDALNASCYQMQLDRDTYRDMCTKMGLVSPSPPPTRHAPPPLTHRHGARRWCVRSPSTLASSRVTSTWRRC